MTSPDVSIIVVTLNRAESLKRTLAALRLQSYPSFEVVVVNGPSTDHTDKVLDSFPDVIAVACPEANISRARNLGIAASAGELVAFIDDDALAEFNWLNKMVAGFETPEVAAVGGLVLDHSGMEFQYRFSSVNRLGATTHRNDAPFDAQSFPGSFEVPYLQGTNAMFRREALTAVHGFDETYEYFHDETDLCVRLVDCGYLIRQLSQGVVHHKSAPSDTRNTERIVTNLFPIVKNTAYFARRHAVGYRCDAQIVDSLKSYAARWTTDLQLNAAAGLIDEALGISAAAIASNALAEGIAAAASGPRLGLFEASSGDPLQCFNAVSPVFASRFIQIAKSIADCADASLPSDGTELRVLVPSPSVSTVELENGVWVHRLQGDDFEAAATQELRRIAEWDADYGIVTHKALGVEFLAHLPSTCIGDDAASKQAREFGNLWHYRGHLSLR